MIVFSNLGAFLMVFSKQCLFALCMTSDFEKSNSLVTYYNLRK